MIGKIIIGVLAALAASGIVFYLFMIVYASYRVYTEVLKRKDKKQWGREISIVNEYTLRMDKEGAAWQKAHDRYKKDVHIVNEGVNLYGEYYDFGSDKAVMLLSGRTESLRYGYYFMKPYSETGINVLVIDPRAHGYSDGEFNTLGFEESKDALAWVRFLESECGIRSVVFHGICIGAATGMFAITSPECPESVKGIVTEGMFINFRESMKNHLLERKRLLFPILQFIDIWCRHYTGHSMKRGPIDVIGKLDKPILMIQSKADKYSTFKNAKKLYERCSSKEKAFVEYEVGDHSMLRLTDTEKYDSAVSEFINKLFVPTASWAEEK